MSFYHSLDVAAKLFTRVGDSSYAAKCEATKNDVKATLDSHWNGSFMI